MSGVLSKLTLLLSVFDKVLDLWRDFQVRQQVRAELKADSLEKQIAARRIANEIDAEVRSLSADALDERLRKYQRD